MPEMLTSLYKDNQNKNSGGILQCSFLYITAKTNYSWIISLILIYRELY